MEGNRSDKVRRAGGLGGETLVGRPMYCVGGYRNETIDPGRGIALFFGYIRVSQLPKHGHSQG